MEVVATAGIVGIVPNMTHRGCGGGLGGVLSVAGGVAGGVLAAEKIMIIAKTAAVLGVVGSLLVKVHSVIGWCSWVIGAVVGCIVVIAVVAAAVEIIFHSRRHDGRW